LSLSLKESIRLANNLISLIVSAADINKILHIVYVNKIITIYRTKIK